MIQYSHQQLDNLQKVSQQIAERQPRTKDGMRIREEQLKQFDEIKDKLKSNQDVIKDRKPYINVKQVVQKLY